RRFTVVLFGLGGLAAATWYQTPGAAGREKLLRAPPPALLPAAKMKAGPAAGPAAPTTGDPQKAQFFDAITLRKKDELKPLFEASQERIRAGKNLEEAITALQGVLDFNEDYYVEVETKDAKTAQKSKRWTSVRVEANNLIGTMSPEGLELYDTM